MFYKSLTHEHNQRLRRVRPMLALAGVAFAIGAILGAHRSSSPASRLGSGFVAAWTRGDYAAMYGDIDAASQRRVSASEFAAAYRDALTTATATGLRLAGSPHAMAGGVTIPVRVQTRLFGPLALSFALKTVQEGEGMRVAWSRSLAFPGLHPGERLTRSTQLPRRASLLARDGSVLAESAAATGSSEASRSSPLGEVASAVLGDVGPVPASRRKALEAQGVPADATVGLSGLERALDDRLRGSPGGELLARRPGGGVGRLLAYAAPKSAPPVRTTVSPAVQRAAVGALGGQLGGIVAIQPSTGEILAVAGLGLNGLQPPGSTFKMITLSAVLAAGIASPRHVFPYASFATLDGVKLNNANGENCGGTLELAFAVSCNSVFAPLGAKLGSGRLVAAAEQFGFNHDPGVAGAPASTLPAASAIQGELDIGSTAIGQGQVLATPLEMAVVATTIADGGRRPRPTFLPPGGTGPQVMNAGVARTVRRLMIGVVRAGTGTAAAIPGVTVAGKTGTAELKSACSPSSESASAEGGRSEPGAERCQTGASEPSNTDAWFAAFAPALHPRVAVCVMLVKDGAGGETAAPVARQVIEAGLHAGG
jgi:cell division protein FtsI/penicillin-binding protein 2